MAQLGMWVTRVVGKRHHIAAGFWVGLTLMAAGLLGPAGNAQAANLGSQTSACVGSGCPASYPQVNACGALGSNGYDEGYSIVTGGNMTVTVGSEAEGRIYVGGSLILSPSRFYNLIAVGAGTCIVPRNSSVTGQPGLVVGSNIDVGAGSTLALDGLSLAVDAKVGGVKTGSGAITSGGSISYSTLVPSSPVDFATLRSNSAYWAGLTANGSTTNQFGTLTFRANDSASLQVFTLAAGVSGVAVDFSAIPANATVLINVTASGAVTINTNNFLENLGAFSSSLTRRIVWNFANASQVNISGTAQFKGSIIVPNGSLTQAVPGTNGRLIVAGDLVQNSSGSEFHNYDFAGDLPNPPSPASLVFSKAYSGDTSPSKVSSQPSISVRAVCSSSGTKTVSFTPPATGSISGLSSGESCTLSETAITGGSLSGGYSFSAVGSASFSGSNPRVLLAGSNAVTVTNPLVAPPPAQLNIVKAYSGDTSPSKVTTQPTIGVRAVCSTSGTKTTSFTAGTTGSITGLIVGETCTVTETSITGGALSGGYTFSPTSSATISLNASTPLTATTAVTITNPLVAPTPARLNIVKAYSGDGSPSKVTTQPSIGVRAVCSVSGTKTTSFVAGTTGSITGLIVGETCTVTETSISGGALSGGYSFAPTSSAIVSLNASTPLTATTAVTLTNPLVAPTPAQLNFIKVWSGDSSPSKVTTPPTIGVSAVCSISGSKSTSFTAGTTGSITGLIVGETCTVTETSISGGALSGAYSFAPTSSATVSLSSSTPLSAVTSVTLTNPLVPPGGAVISLSKLYANDSVPSRVLTPPTISVSANCSVSGLKTTSFTAGSTGQITGLVVGETCSLSETAVSGGSLSGGYSFASPAAAVISLSNSTPLTANTSVNITNTLQAPNPAQLSISKVFANDTVPSKVTLAPTITVQAQCSISGLKSVSFTAGSTATLSGLVQGETCSVSETALSGGALADGYSFQSPSLAQISLAPGTPLTANTQVVISNPLLPSVPASLLLTKLYANDTVPSKVLDGPMISVSASCSVSGLKNLSFKAGSTGVISGLIVGETCSLSETAISGGSLAGGYSFAAPSTAVISLSPGTPLSVSTAVTLTNSLVPPGGASLSLVKAFANDSVPSKVLQPPTIFVQANCSVSGLKSTSFTAGSTGNINGLIVGETCSVSETALSGGSLADGYRFAAPSTAQISLSSNRPLDPSTAVTITNLLEAPGAAEILLSKRWSGDSTPSRIVLPPTLTVQALCSISGQHSISFPSNSIGRLSGLVQGESCRLSETAINGGELSGGYQFDAPGSAQISLAADTPLAATQEVQLSNPLLPPGEAVLLIRKLWLNDSAPSRVLSPPQITVQADCSASGRRSVSFSADSAGRIAGLQQGERCSLSETALSGGSLAEGYRYAGLDQALFSLAANTPLQASNSVSVSNPLLAPLPARLVISKRFDGNAAALQTLPLIRAQANCSKSGLKSLSFQPPAQGLIDNLSAGERCEVSELGADGAVLSGGHVLAPVSSALVAPASLNLVNGDNAVSISNAVLLPQLMTVAKAYQGDAGRLLTQPLITVQASCSSTGLHSVSFRPPATGTIGSLALGESCTLSETSASGATLSGGFVLAPVGQASFSPAATLQIGDSAVNGGNAVTVVNRIVPPNPVVDLLVRKSHSPASFTAGGLGQYRIIVSNQGPAATSQPYQIVDTLPAGLSLAALPQGLGWDCSASEVGGQVARCSSSTVIPGAGSRPVDNPNAIVLQVKVASDAGGAVQGQSCQPGSHGQVTNVVQVSGGGEANDPVTQGNNRYEDETPVLPLGAISGEVWVDLNHDRRRDANEPAKSGWIVEVLDAQDKVVGSAVSDARGQYQVSGIPSGDGYSVRFKDPASGAYFGRPVSRDPSGGNDPSADAGTGIVAGGTIRNLSVPACGQGRVQQSLPLDPAGVTYCSSTRAPLAGVKVELLDAAGVPVPPSCMVGGVSSVVTQVGAPGGVDGGYHLLLANPAPATCPGAGVYRLRVSTAQGDGLSRLIQPQASTLKPPANCSNASTGGVCTVQDQPSAPTPDQPTTYYMSMWLDPAQGPDIVNNHIPLDACVAPQLFVSKTVDRNTAELGDSVRYTVTVKRADAGRDPLPGVRLNDRLPAGFVYIPGTAQLDGRPLAEPRLLGAGQLQFDLGSLLPKAQVRLNYRVRLGVGSLQGTGINKAQACVGSLPGVGLCSNEAEVRVKVTGGVFSNEACFSGKIYVDCNHNQVQDAEEIGIPGVRLYMEDGSYVISDVEGKYSRCGLRPMSHVLVADPATLPRGSQLVSSSNRNAGDAASLFLDLHNGELQRADFIEGSCSIPVLSEVQRRRQRGELALPQRDAAPALALRFDPEPEPPPAQAPAAVLAELDEAPVQALAGVQTQCVPRRQPVLSPPPRVPSIKRPAVAKPASPAVVKPAPKPRPAIKKPPKPLKSPQLPSSSSAPALPECGV
ncbi:DUF5979 domain-containing protein [Paucibacter sp. AS339]|uniref:DUF5979 domain-containing protein n=1 Tax=Paucibacter hankyongi TaxID=3133434 RepID=UPI0030962083